MKKSLLMFLTSAFLALGVMVVLPQTEVRANAYTDMNYDQVVDFWSSQPAFYNIYMQEVGKSQYVWNVKSNIKEYFKASLTDYCLHPDILQNERPMTFSYMQGVISLSNPSIYYGIINSGYSYTLQEKLLEEMNSIAPYLSYKDKCDNVAILTSYLNHQGVYTVDQYENWKNLNGGMTAFEVYCHHVKDLSDSWTDAIKQATEAQNAYNQQVMQQAQEQQDQLNQQIQDAYEQQQQMMQQQQDMMNQMMGN